MSKNKLRSKMSKFARVGADVVLILGSGNGFSHTFFYLSAALGRNFQTKRNFSKPHHRIGS